MTRNKEITNRYNMLSKELYSKVGQLGDNCNYVEQVKADKALVEEIAALAAELKALCA
jgi:hypothetical protein